MNLWLCTMYCICSLEKVRRNYICIRKKERELFKLPGSDKATDIFGNELTSIDCLLRDNLPKKE